MLWIDDDRNLVEAISEFVEELGIMVVPALGGPNEGLQLLQRHDFQLVVANFRGTSSDAMDWEVARRLRDAAAPVPVAIASGWKLSREEVEQQGFAFLLEKPFDTERMLELLAQALRPQPVLPAHQRVIGSYFEALGKKDWDALLALCTDEVVYNLPGEDPRFSRNVRGKKALRSFSEETFNNFPDATFTVEELLSLPWAVVARYRGRWSEGRVARELPGAVLFRFDHDRISEIGVRLDLRQLSAPQ